MSRGGIGAYVRACYGPVWVVAEDSRATNRRRRAEDPTNRERGDAAAP